MCLLQPRLLSDRFVPTISQLRYVVRKCQTHKEIFPVVIRYYCLWIGDNNPDYFYECLYCYSFDWPNVLRRILNGTEIEKLLGIILKMTLQNLIKFNQTVVNYMYCIAIPKMDLRKQNKQESHLGCSLSWWKYDHFMTTSWHGFTFRITKSFVRKIHPLTVSLLLLASYPAKAILTLLSVVPQYASVN